MAAKLTTPRTARPGDRLIVRAHRQGQAQREGEILELMGSDRIRYRVRWLDDDHESVIYPGEDVFVVRRARER
jgi:Domain of unknown function (DUF1918)